MKIYKIITIAALSVAVLTPIPLTTSVAAPPVVSKATSQIKRCTTPLKLKPADFALRGTWKKTGITPDVLLPGYIKTDGTWLGSGCYAVSKKAYETKIAEIARLTTPEAKTEYVYKGGDIYVATVGKNYTIAQVLSPYSTKLATEITVMTKSNHMHIIDLSGPSAKVPMSTLLKIKNYMLKNAK